MQSILSFYQKIYEQELSQSKLIHLYSSRILKRYFVSDTEELLTGEHPLIPISSKHGEEIIKTLELKSNEVALKYYAFARVSRFISLQKYETTRVYPLIAFEAQVVIKNGEYYLEIDLADRQVLKNNLPGKITGDPAFKKLQFAELIDLHFVTKLKDIIDRVSPEANTDDLIFYPKLWNNRKLKGYSQKKFEPGDTYLPIGTLVIAEKENNSFTTLNELLRMEREQDYSAPLKALFKTIENKSEEKLGILCEELNRSQLHAIENSNEKIVSVISGPPGTGKSFTIANIAAEKVSKGQSILITSKNKEALDVIENKIKDQLKIPNLCVNPSKDKNFNWMKDHLKFVLGRSYRWTNDDIKDIEKAFNQFQSYYDKHLTLEKDLIRQFRLEKEYVSSLENGLAKNTSTLFKDRIVQARGKTTTPLWESLETYYNRIDRIRSKAVQTLRKVNTFMLEQSIRKDRKNLRHYLSFLRARAQERKEKLAQEITYEAVLKAFPVWLIRANDVSRALPLEKEVFDVLIIDEASQCDIPSVLPLMQRAKKVIIVGDTKQLTHISFISKAFELACKQGVPTDLKDYCRHRDHSILHLAEDILNPIDQVQLNEHFRSQFPIIAFSNTQFYHDRLDILTKRPVSIAEHVHFIKTEGKRIKGVHEEEAQAIVAKIRNIIQGEKCLPKDLKTTIGILSPFRKQVDHIFDLTVQNFKLSEITAHRIIVGTAFTFQGNERDLMLLSLSLDDDALGGSFNFLNRKDVFNVSVTRARGGQHIYHSFNPDKLKADSTLGRFFHFYQKDLEDDKGRATKDAFCNEVLEILWKNGLQTWTNFEVSGITIDLLTQIEDQYIGIDLIGFPGEMEDYYSLERYKMIERGKIRLFPLSYALWKGDKERCLNVILNLIEQVENDEKITVFDKKTSPPKKDEAVIKTNVAKPKTKKVKAKPLSLEEIIITTNKSNPDGIAFKAVHDNNQLGDIHVEYHNAGTESFAYMWFKVESGYKYKGIEELLLETMLKWFDIQTKVNQIVAHVRHESRKEKAILEKTGFVWDETYQITPNFNSKSGKDMRMVFHKA